MHSDIFLSQEKYKHLQKIEWEVKKIASILKVSPEQIVDRVKKLIEDTNTLRIKKDNLLNKLEN